MLFGISIVQRRCLNMDMIHTVFFLISFFTYSSHWVLLGVCMLCKTYEHHLSVYFTIFYHRKINITLIRIVVTRNIMDSIHHAHQENIMLENTTALQRKCVIIQLVFPSFSSTNQVAVAGLSIVTVVFLFLSTFQCSFVVCICIGCFPPFL